jgi:hypothetical protein
MDFRSVSCFRHGRQLIVRVSCLERVQALSC